MSAAQEQAQQLAAAARRGAVTLASDPEMRHYSPDTLALVYSRVILDMAGAGSLEKATEKIAADPALVGVPIDALAAIAGASFKHFALALGADEAAS